MSRKKVSDQPKQDDDIHTTPPEGLRNAIENEGPAAKKGEEILKEALGNSLPPAPKPPDEEDEEDEDENDVDMDEAAEDLGEAAGVFAQGVDTITGALFVILGKFDENLKRTERIIRQQKSITWLMMMVFASLAFVLWRVESVIGKLSDAEVHLTSVSAQVTESASALRELANAQKKTDKKVDEVKAENEKKPDIEIVPDSHGGAKVIITPKKNGDDVKTPKTPKSAEPPAPPPTIEIPIPGSKQSQQEPVAP